MTARSVFTPAAGMLFVGALAHVVGLLMGPDVIAFMGAPEGFVQSYRDGHVTHVAVTTLGIAALLIVWGLYALSAGGSFRKLPLTRWVIGFVSVIFLLRGTLVVLMIPRVDWSSAFHVFHVFASLYVLAIGALLAWGLWNLGQAKS